MLVFLRKVTPFEYLTAIVAILTIVFWRNPVPAVLAGKPSYFILLHFLGLLATFVYGSRILFKRDAMFAAFQWAGFFGIGIVPAVLLLLVHMTIDHHASLGMVALGWLVCGITALAFLLPGLEGHKSVRYPTRRGRALRIVPWVLGCVIAALITMLLPPPKTDPALSPYRAWFPRESL